MRSSARSSTSLATSLAAIDADFSIGGLARSRRGGALAFKRKTSQSTAAPEELMRPVAAAVRAANGAWWLPIAGHAPGHAKGWDLPWLWSGFSTRKGGRSRAYCPEDAEPELNLGFTAEDDRSAVTENRRLLVEAATGNAETPLVVVRQFHSNLVIRTTADDTQRERPRRADGVITDEPGLLLAVQVADCIPVLVADRRRRVVGAFHAGWRGTVRRIVEIGVGRMRLEFGSRPEDLIAAIGPGNGPCCYSVGEEVISEFESQFVYARELVHEVYSVDPVRNKYPMLFLTQRAPGHSDIGPQTHIDLVEANRRQLLDAGLSQAAISIVGGCTACHPKLFYSHRASHGYAGRMMGVIGVRQGR